MGQDGKDEIMVCGSEVSGCSEATVEIKIKTLDSQTYTLRVDKCVPVPALKEQIASVTGVVSEQQRLICRGKVLKDDQLLSAYHVEDGHTLHLVARQPIPPLSETSPDYPGAEPASSAGDSHGSQRARVVVGSFNIGEQEDGVFSDLSQLVSAVLGSIGITNAESVIEGGNDMGLSHERLSRQSDSSTGRDSIRTNAGNQSSNPLTPPQPSVIPDSLTTLSECLNHLRREFVANGFNNNSQASGTSRSDVQEPDLTPRRSGLPRPSHLAEVLQSMRQLLVAEVAECLSSLASQLEDHVNVTDSSSRMHSQLNVLQAGVLLENLGASLLELGRTTMMLRLGQTPVDAVVNAGPAVFISSSGPNPIMVQPHPSRLGTSFGAVPVGSVQPSSLSGGSLGSGPRNIEIRIRTGSWMPSAGVNQREESATEQSPGQTNPTVSGLINSTHSVRGTSDSSRSPVALVIPVVARYQHVSSGERSSGGADAAQQESPESARQQRQGDNNVGTEIPNGQGLSDLRNRLNQMLRINQLLNREEVHVGNPNTQNTTNPSAETNETIMTNTQEAAPTVSEEGTFLSRVLQQIIPFVSQNLAASSSHDAPMERDSSSGSRQAPSRQDAGSNGETSSRRPEPESPPDTKRQKRE